jgi:hypothetical protein
MRLPRIGRLAGAPLLTAIVLVCTGALLLQRSTGLPALSLLRAHAAPAPSTPVLLVAFQARDCDGNLEFLSVLQRPVFKGRVPAVALFSGSREEFRRVYPRLASRYPHVSFTRLSRKEARSLAVLGHRSTPYWALLDQAGAVRVSGPAPGNPMDYNGFAELVALATHFDRSSP